MVNVIVSGPAVTSKLVGVNDTDVKTGGVTSLVTAPNDSDKKINI